MRSLTLAAIFALSASAGFAQGVSGADEIYGTDTVGKAISSGFMGNTSNPSGKGKGVLPSRSPGPHTNDGGFGNLGKYASGQILSGGGTVDNEPNPDTGLPADQ